MAVRSANVCGDRRKLTEGRRSVKKRPLLLDVAEPVVLLMRRQRLADGGHEVGCPPLAGGSFTLVSYAAR
jgi:hypothetical protein